MKWLKDQYTENFICPKCGMMVRNNGYNGCDYTYCPYCGRDIEPVIFEPVQEENHENKELH